MLNITGKIMMDKNIKKRKFDIKRTYPEPTIHELVKKLETTRSALYKGYVNDDKVNEVFNEIESEIKNLLNEIDKIKQDEEIQHYMKTHKKEILELFDGQFMIKEIMIEKIKELMENEKNTASNK